MYNQRIFSTIFPYLKTQDDTPAPIIPLNTPDGPVPGKAEYNISVPEDAPTAPPIQPAGASVGNPNANEPDAPPMPAPAIPDTKEGLIASEMTDAAAKNAANRIASSTPLGTGDATMGSGREVPADATPTDTGPTPAPPPRRDKKGRPIDAKGKVIPKTFNEQHPNYQDPYPDPQSESERKANDLARIQETIKNPVDMDHGIKGRIGEIIQNFLAGLGQTPQGASVKQALLLGAAGAGAGAFNRTLNERRQAEQDLPAAMRDVQFSTTLDQHRAAVANDQNQIQNRNARLVMDIGEDQWKKLDATQKNILSIYKDADEVDFGTPEGAALKAQADAAHLTILPKHKGDKFGLQFSPDGHPVVFNQGTGQYTIGSESLAKSQAINEKELPDELFPFLGPEQKDRSGEESKARTEGHALQNTAADYEKQAAAFTSSLDKEKKADLMAKAAEARNKGNSLIEQSNEIQGAADPEQKALRGEVAKFRIAVGSNQPKAGAKPVARTEVVDTFNAIMALKDPEVRKERLKKFYDSLPNIQIR